MKRIHLFGASGSIGGSALQVLRERTGDFSVATLSVYRNTTDLADWIEEFAPARVAIGDRAAHAAWLAAHPEQGERLLPAPAPLATLLEVPADIALNAVLGFAGLELTLAALDAGCDVALANKESLVCGGEVLREARRAARGRLLPVDSEHSALFQLLADRPAEEVERVWLTASGGPFRDLPLTELAAVTPEQALRHPTWDMGPKISVDSATLMNKGLEIIEAALLFDLPIEKLGVLIHPASTVHALVEWRDASVFAQLSRPDMRQPILHALGHPRRLTGDYGKLSFDAGLSLEFFPLDDERFPAVALAREALRRGGTACLALNAADEIAVDAFLAGKLPFNEIVETVRHTLDEETWPPAQTYAELHTADRAARRIAEGRVARHGSGSSLSSQE
jgi:1-deoxy-D-xylulose-5-phosphate reductoisomerase